MKLLKIQAGWGFGERQGGSIKIKIFQIVMY